MTPPKAPMALTILGFIPFFYGTIASYGFNLGFDIAPYEARWIVFFYGVTILSFMGGVYWGFIARRNADNLGLYTLSVMPALWAFGTVCFGMFLEPSTFQASFYLLCAGFGLVLVIDLHFYKLKLAPEWWITLRIPITVCVVLSFILTQNGG